MSLQWTFIATFLYAEISICLLLMLPFISAARWQKVFKSKLLKAFSSYANVYFNIFILILLVLFIDSIRDVRRYSTPSDEVDLKNNPNAEHVIHMKLFRAQRNFYIAGFALFLFIVLRKLVVLISNKATLEADVTATRKQAESATAVAKQMLEDQDNVKNESKKLESSVDGSELEMTRRELDKTREELRKSQIDLKGMKSQAKSLHLEYDRLSAEHASLQVTVYKLATSDHGNNPHNVKPGHLCSIM